MVAAVLNRGASQGREACLDIALQDLTDLRLWDLVESVGKAPLSDFGVLGWCRNESELEARGLSGGRSRALGLTVVRVHRKLDEGTLEQFANEVNGVQFMARQMNQGAGIATYSV